MNIRHLKGGAFALATLVFLALTLVLGGSSSGGPVLNLILQLLGAGLAGWSIGLGTSRPLRMQPAGFGAALVLLVLAQFLPLPLSWWARLPGRAEAANALGLLNLHPDGLMLSLAPWNSLASLAQCIPPLAIWLAMGVSRAPSARACAITIAMIAAMSVPLGFAQRFGAEGYLYVITNQGAGPGFFANANHQCSFLLMVTALVTPLLMHLRHARLWGALGGAMLLSGLAINGSLAATALLPAEIMALVLLSRERTRRPIIMASMAAVAIAVVAGALFWPGANDLVGHGREFGIDRKSFLRLGLRMLHDTFPQGSGLGSFPLLYPLYENPALTGPTYVNHAHNDVLEVLVETGIFGLWALTAFAGWFAIRVRRHLVTPQLTMASAAMVAVGVEMMHSLVDYPLRTAALASMFALCCRLVDQDAARSLRNTTSA